MKSEPAGLIRPKAELRARLLSLFSKEVAEIYLDSYAIYAPDETGQPFRYLWFRRSNEEAQRMDAASEELVKLSYLARLRVWLQNKTGEFERLFGQAELDATLFDCWWELSEPFHIEHIGQMRSFLGSAADVIRSGNPFVIQFIARSNESAEPS